MNEKIFYSEYFYQKGSKETDTLEKIAKEYPYSSLAAFMLLYHYKKIAHPGFEKLAKKTALLFNNSHWLQFQLYDNLSVNNPEEIITGENLQEEKEITTGQRDELSPEISSVQNPDEDANETKEEFSTQVHDHEKRVEQNEIIPGAISEKNTQQESEIKENFEEAVLNNSFQYQEPFAHANSENESNQVHEIINEQNEIVTDRIPEENTQSENEIKNNFEETSLSNFFQQEESIVSESIESESEQEISINPNEINTGKVPENSDEEYTQYESEVKENSEDIQVPESSQESVSNENAENADGIIAFEPLHTVDYFASQGIKINEELLTNDKLGSQMKSFTAWLRSMKKLHPGKLEEQSVANEKLIQTSADESNINTEVLTEAMAEVLIKQDKKEKAIEMFSKLSLINPSKSAYFAARIESIKSN
jgi:hypothetical protein